MTNFKKKKKFSNHENNFKKKDSPVKAKKHLGQHFLDDDGIAKKIGNTLTLNNYQNVIEIGPGTGLLTKHLLGKEYHLKVLDIDTESITYLKENFSLEHASLINKTNSFSVIEVDFLKTNLIDLFNGEEFAITGNFPYNISSQIVFKAI